jgi:hypothetical protein
MMLKNYLAMFCLTLTCELCLASTCPSMADIKNNALQGWKAYDSDEHKPLSLTRELAFKKHAHEFALAEWVDHGNKTSSIHCYYRDLSGSNMEAYLTKDDYSPMNAKNYWYKVSGFLQCAAGSDNCEFVANQVPKTRLAKK